MSSQVLESLRSWNPGGQVHWAPNGPWTQSSLQPPLFSTQSSSSFWNCILHLLGCLFFFLLNCSAFVISFYEHSLLRHKHDIQYSLQIGDSSAPLGQSLWPLHNLSRSIHTWSVGHCHCPDGQVKGGVGQFCSSLMSLQSFSPSHNQLIGMHILLGHWKKLDPHVTGGQELCSSDPSSQSGWPSHSHSSGMQKPSVWHWNSSSWQSPGPRVAGDARDNQKRLFNILLPWSLLKKKC